MRKTTYSGVPVRYRASVKVSNQKEYNKECLKLYKVITAITKPEGSLVGKWLMRMLTGKA